MSCPGERLEAWVRGELRTAAAVAISQHVRSCEACHRESAWLRAERRVFAARRAAQGPSPQRMLELRQMLEQRWEGERRRRSALRRTPRVARILGTAASAGAAVMLALVFASIPKGGDPATLTAGFSCVSVEAAGFCAMPPVKQQMVAQVEDQFGACLMATPWAAPASPPLCR